MDNEISANSGQQSKFSWISNPLILALIALIFIGATGGSGLPIVVLAICGKWYFAKQKRVKTKSEDLSFVHGHTSSKYVSSSSSAKGFFIQRDGLKPNVSGFQTDEEERAALQGEAMLRMLEAGHSTENAMKVHDAIGELYDMKKSKGEIGGRDN